MSEVAASERSAVSPDARQGAPTHMQSLIVRAVETYAAELRELTFLPELRYDRTVFPTTGQYDWVSGQVLYALVRHTRPRTIVEFSTSSGYSTTFAALALRRNGRGRVHTIDIDREAQAAAERWFTQNGLTDVVALHLGDCRVVVPALLADGVDLLFVDTLHSFDMAEWYLLDVVPRLDPAALVHVHDVMPPEARVRVHGGPPYPPSEPRPRPPLTHLAKRFVWLLLRARWPNPFPARPPREILPLDSLTEYPPDQPGMLATIDGNYFEEAVLIRDLVREVPPEDAVYLARLAPHLPVVEPQRFAPQDRIQRSDPWGRPLEWNEVLWCRAATLHAVTSRARVHAIIERLRATHYRGRRRSP